MATLRPVTPLLYAEQDGRDTGRPPPRQSFSTNDVNRWAASSHCAAT